MSNPIVATLESGGTKMVAALARGPDEILFRESIPTTSPDETIARLIHFYQRSFSQTVQPEVLAIGTFGPAELDLQSPQYGFITSTPKPYWAQTDLVGPFKKALGLPVVFETDVAAALMGEAKWGAARGMEHVAYFTVGTGIGGSLMMGGRLIHGVGHSEMGHMRLARHPDDHFEGACPFHRDCLEGLASGTAMKKRWNVPAQELPADHPGWRIEAHYLAQACCNVLMVAPPERIILGGGVNHQPALLALVRDELRKLLNGYLNYDQLSGQLESYLVSPELGDDAGILGCVALGQQYLSLS